MEGELMRKEKGGVTKQCSGMKQGEEERTVIINEVNTTVGGKGTHS